MITIKKLFNGVFVASTLVALMAIVGISGCKDDEPDPTQAEKVTIMLTSAQAGWQPSSVTVDGVEVKDDLFSGFTIKFTENTFTTTGTSPVWERQDTWTFKDEAASVIIRGSDGKEITIVSISDTQLKLALEWDQTTTTEGRKASLKGKHEFTLNK